MKDQHWELQGSFSQLIYAPDGAIEGLLLDVDGVPAQFVTKPHHEAELLRLKSRQKLTLVGSVRKPSHKGEPAHEVFDLVEIAGRDEPKNKTITGKVVRLNYAKHGEANGVVLNTGDFVHTKPEGLAHLGWKLGDSIKVTGRARPLRTGKGVVVEFVERG